MERGYGSLKTKVYTESDYKPPLKPPDVPQLSRILLDHLDLEMDLDIDFPHNNRNKTRKILYPECIGIIFLMFRKVKIVMVNLIEFF